MVEIFKESFGFCHAKQIDTKDQY